MAKTHLWPEKALVILRDFNRFFEMICDPFGFWLAENEVKFNWEISVIFYSKLAISLTYDTRFLTKCQ